MRKEVQFKAVSAFIFFAGVLFGFNDATKKIPNTIIQDGYFPTFEDHQNRPNVVFIPSYRGYCGTPSSPVDSGGHSHETNVVYTVGDINGVPYFTRTTTYDATDSLPFYGRYPEFAPHYAEMPQSPQHARKPVVIYFTKNPTALSSPGRFSKVPGDGLFHFRTANEPELSEEAKQVAPRLLLRHLFPFEPKSKRFHYSRRTNDEGLDPKNKRLSRLARMYKIWYALHESPNDKSRVHSDRVIKPTKYKAQPTQTEHETDQLHVPPNTNTPPEGDKQPLTLSQPHSADFSRAYSSGASPELTRPHHSFPDDPDDVHIRFPSGPYYSDEDLSPAYPHYPSSFYYPENEPPPAYPPVRHPSLHYPEYFPPLHFPEDQPPPPYAPYPPSPHFPEGQVLPVHRPPSHFTDQLVPVHRPPSHFPEDQLVPVHRPPSHFPEDQLVPVHRPPSHFPEDQLLPVHRPPSHFPEDQPPPVRPPSSHFPEDQLPPVRPPSSHFPEDQLPPVLPPSSHFPEDQLPPVLPPSSHFPEDQLPPVRPSSHFPEDQLPPVRPSSHFPEDQLPPVRPPSSHFPEDQSPLSFRQYPPRPYFTGQTEYRSFPEYPSSLSFHSDDREFPFVAPLPFMADDKGLPFFPPIPFFPKVQEPSSFSQPQTPSYYAGAVTSGEYPTTILYTKTTTSRPSSHNRNSKSHITVQTKSPATEILVDGSQLPCGTTKKSKNPGDKLKISKQCFGTTDNELIVLTNEEDDSSSKGDETKPRPRFRFSYFSFIKKLVKLIFKYLITRRPYSGD